MKKLLFVLLTAAMLHGCSGSSQEPADQPDVQQPPAAEQSDTPAPQNETPTQPQTPSSQPNPEQQASDEENVYGNEIFQNVTVRKTGEDTYEVKGQAKVFEAVLHYVVEDGHNELTEGSINASAGAPAWGDFTHTIQVKKAEPNSTLMLVLFEKSAKDGSRRMELIIPLPNK